MGNKFEERPGYIEQNLNKVRLDDGTSRGMLQVDYSISSGKVEAYFKNLEDVLIDKIKQSKVVVGCVAWLTNPRILKAMQSVPCSIIVQKEDFLRPDSKGSKTELHYLYSRLHYNFSRFDMPIIAKYNTHDEMELDAIRCVGSHNSTKNSAHPRSHHKFIVFCDIKDGEASLDDGELCPYNKTPVPTSVWTGSFNFTNNANNSLENAVVINDPVIAEAYFKEYAQVMLLSEKLDRETPWVSPEYRIGS